MRAGRSLSIFLLGVCDDVALQVVALHQRFVVEIGYTCVFDVATHIKNLIGGHIVSEISRRQLGYLARLKKIWRKELKWVVGLDQPGRRPRLKVVKELVRLGNSRTVDHWHVDERRALAERLLTRFQVHPVHDVPAYFLS